MSRSPRPTRRRPSGVLLTGVFLVLFGLLLMADRLELVVARDITRAWWPLVVVVLGLWLISRRSRTSGAIVLVLGVAALLSTTGVVAVDLLQFLFPTLLVVVGVLVLLSARGVDFGSNSATAILGSRSLAGESSELADRSATTILGESEIEVTGGESFELATFTLLGETLVYVPRGWNVRNDVTAILGESSQPKDAASDGEGPTLRITGVVLLGEMEVRWR